MLECGKDIAEPEELIRIKSEMRFFVTIDDELIREFIDPDRYGEVGKKALIIKVVGIKNIRYKLEEPTYYYIHYDGSIQPKIELVKMTPDITIMIPIESRQIAIELENDIDWDFQKSLQQVKKYKNKFEDVRVIIPEKYKLFAPLYKNEDFRVYLWKAKRKWQCLRCGTININESRFPPKCEGKDSQGKNCTNKSRDGFDLVGLKDADVYEYE